jgi:hypothetical protein
LNLRRESITEAQQRHPKYPYLFYLTGFAAGLVIAHFMLGWQASNSTLFACATGILAKFAAWWLVQRPAASHLFRQRAGLCVLCGYDLRATPDQSPECGTEPHPRSPNIP